MGPGMDEPAGGRRRPGRPRRRRPVGGTPVVKYLDEYRDPVLARKLIAEIHRVTTRPWTLMEVCGGQTHTIVKQGIDEMLPAGVRMIHGPGCPVCVTPLEQVDKALAIAARPDVIFTSYGDMLRVPGLDDRPAGAQGPRRRRADRLLAARRAPDRRWPTRTARSSSSPSASRRPRRPTRWPSAEAARLRHRQLQRPRVSHVLVPPAMTALLESPHEPGPGVPGRRPRLRRHGLDRVRADRREVPRPDRRDRLRAARPARGDPDGDPPARGGPGRGREPVRPRRAARGQPLAQETIFRVFEVGERKWRGDRRDPVVRLPPAAGVRPLRRRAQVRRRRDPHARAPGLHRRRDPDRREDAARLHRVRRPVHAPEAARRADGLVRGDLRRVLRRRARARRAGPPAAARRAARCSVGADREAAVRRPSCATLRSVADRRRRRPTPTIDRRRRRLPGADPRGRAGPPRPRLGRPALGRADARRHRPGARRRPRPGGPLNDAAVVEVGGHAARLHDRLVRRQPARSSPAATSASWRSTARSTTWR